MDKVLRIALRSVVLASTVAACTAGSVAEPRVSDEGATGGSSSSGGGNSDGSGGADANDSSDGSISDTTSSGTSSSNDSGTTSETGSGGPEGGTTDASVGVSDGGGVKSCAETNYLICEDFESTAVGAVPTGWQRSCLYGGANCVPAADVAVASDEAYLSTQSLKLGVTGTGGQNYRTIARSGAVLGTGHWGRIYYKVQVPVPAYFSHDTFVNLQGNGPTDGAEDVRVIDTVQNADHTHQFLYNVQPAGNEFGTGSDYNYNFADNKWHCAEYHLDNPTQSYAFYLDGVEVPKTAVNNGAGKYNGSQIPAAITTIGVGVNQYQNPPAGQAVPLWFTMWIDDVAFDTKRIGCN